MTAWLGALLLVAGFAVLCKLFGLVSRTRQVLTLARQSLVVLGDATLPDEAKEKALQANALHLFRLFGLLTAAGAAAFALPLAGLWGADHYGLLSWDEVLATTLSWPFLSLSTVAALVVLGLRSRRRRAPALPRDGFENRYSTADQWLHQIAFSTVPAQLAVADIEDRLHRNAIRRIAVERPVFITALPRAGTTLLLECCAGLDEFSSHTYRQMPFVLTPLLWERFSRAFRVNAGARERAHGDGMAVSVDSPEALEEVLWLAFWRRHYEPDRIRPWNPREANPEFLEFFRGHIRKLVLATHGTPAGGTAVRYVSKNNANIARIPWLAGAFPDARFLVLFREPLQHAASLRRQHHNFLELHRTDDFARRYMAGIGHFEFGANLRPIDFFNWLGSDAPAAQADGLTFWLRYWTVAYRQLLEVAEGPPGDRLRVVDFDAFCYAPDQVLANVAAFLEIRNLERFTAEARRIRPPKPHGVDTSGVAPAVLDEARRVHARLTELAGIERGQPAGTSPEGPGRAGRVC